MIPSPNDLPQSPSRIFTHATKALEYCTPTLCVTAKAGLVAGMLLRNSHSTEADKQLSQGTFGRRSPTFPYLKKEQEKKRILKAPHSVVEYRSIKIVPNNIHISGRVMQAYLTSPKLRVKVEYRTISTKNSGEQIPGYLPYSNTL